jgi:hypothetical protein
MVTVAKAMLLAALAAGALGAQWKKDLCKVAGSVTNGIANQPVRKAKVSLQPDDPAKTLYTVVSDAGGKFHFDDIEPGRYAVLADKEGFVRSDGPETTLDLRAGKDLTDVALKLMPESAIAGRVLDDEGSPVSGATVTALRNIYIRGHRQLVPVMNGMPIRTNDVGEYRLSGLRAGHYVVRADARKAGDIQTDAPQIEVAAGAEVRGIDLRLKKIPVQTMSGTVIDAAGKPVTDGVLMLYPLDEGVMSILPAGTFTIQGDAGAFEMSGIASGSYNVMAMSNREPGNLILVSKLDVTGQPARDLVLRLGSGLDLPVNVKMLAGGDPSGLRVALQPDDSLLASMNSAQIGRDGGGVLKRVNPEQYKIMIAGLRQGQYLQTARVGSIDVLANGLDLRNGVAGTLELTIGSPAAKLSGSVKNDRNEPAKGATVTVIAKDPGWRIDMTHTATTDQNGHFEVNGLVPAEYRIYAWAVIEEGAAEDQEFRKPYEGFRADVDLRGNSQAVSIELKLIPK